MICCSVRKNDCEYEINIEGHSGYETIGKDIVCSAVSTAMQMTVNLLQKFNYQFKFSSDENKPMMNVKVKKYNSDYCNCVIILDNLIDCLDDISKQYKRYLTIKYL